MKFTVTRTIQSQQKLSRKLLREGKTIALAPTMGYLHEGHLSLIRRGLREADIVVTSIFVNPTQFAPNEDFERYPRDTKGDLEKIRKAGGGVVFIPAMADMYPTGYETYVMMEQMTSTLEGRSRPGHFRGVLTIVAKLFNIVRPDVAIFGMKDYQQAMVIKKMVKDLDFPIKIVLGKTIREKDGLAMSSRNSYLSDELRPQASALYKSLKAARDMVKEKVTETKRIERRMREVIAGIAPEGKIDYIAFTEMESLRAVERIGKNTVASLAMRLGSVRLIDNMKIG